MEITFSPELEAALNRIASETGRAPYQVVVDLVTAQLDHHAWFRRDVRKGIASLDRSEYVEHEEVGRRMREALRRI